MAREYFASDYAYGVNPDSPALIITQGASGTGAQTFQVGSGIVPKNNVRNVDSFSPLATNAPVVIGAGSSAETVTPSAVTNSSSNAQPANFTATVSNVHGGGTIVTSGTFGLQEALNRASNDNGGAVIVDGRWASLGGTTSTITSAANGNGTHQPFILDLRGSSFAQYTWNGSAWVAAGTGSWAAGANGQSLASFTNTENLTLSTSALTTDTTGNLLPANSMVLFVNGTVSTTITGITNWQLGDGSTAGRFSAVDTTLTAGEAVPKTSFPPVQMGTGVASATTGMYQAAAAKVRVTVTSTAATAGAVRITTYGFTLVNATS